MLWRIIEPEVVPTCAELGIGQIVWSPMAQGVLSGKYNAGPPDKKTRLGRDTIGDRDLGVAQIVGEVADELSVR